MVQVHKPRLPSTGHFQHFHYQRHLKWFPDPERVPPAPPGSGRGTAPGCSVFILSTPDCELVRLHVTAICYHLNIYHFASLTNTKHVSEVCRVLHPPSSWLSCFPSCPEGLEPWLGRSQLLAGDIRTISKHQLLPDQITLQLGRGADG